MADDIETGGIRYERDFLRMEREGLDFLHELEKPSNNLFFANWISGGYSDVPYRISAVNINAPSMTFDKDANKQPIFKSGDYNDELTITWMEDPYRSVEKDHLKWVDRWYNFHNDCLYIGRGGKFRDLWVGQYHYRNLVENSSKIPIAAPEKTLNLCIYGLVPTKIPQWEFKWGEASSPTVDISYKFSYIQMEYYKQAGDYLYNQKDMLHESSYTNNLGLTERSTPGDPHKDGNENPKYSCSGGIKHWYNDTKIAFSNWDWELAKEEKNNSNILNEVGMVQ